MNRKGDVLLLFIHVTLNFNVTRNIKNPSFICSLLVPHLRITRSLVDLKLFGYHTCQRAQVVLGIDGRAPSLRFATKEPEYVGWDNHVFF